MRILMASDFYYPILGGAERQVQLLSHELSLRGHQVSVATVWQKGLCTEEDDSGVRIFRLKAMATQVPWFSKDSGRRFHPPFPDVSVVMGLRRIIKDFHPDIIQTCGWITYSCLQASSREDIPVIVSVRDYGFSCATRMLMNHNDVCNGPSVLKCLKCATNCYGAPKAFAAVSGISVGRSLIFRKARSIHSISGFVEYIVERDLFGKRANLLKSKGGPILDVRIPSFLGKTHQEQNLKESDSKDFVSQLPTKPYILYVGALQLHKGIAQLLAAYERLNSPPPLLLIGTIWPETPKVFPLGVKVLHNIRHQDVMTAWADCLFGVAPSVWPEPLGAVIFEAMSAGKAVIGTFPGGHSEMIVDGKTGLLVPHGDIAGLANGMSRLINDPQLRASMGRAALDRVSLFTAEAVVPKFEALYHDLRRKHSVKL